MSLVSVIIPCFNSERWIGDAIESALRQTYDSIEVIVVDDGSTDASLAVARSFGGRVKCETGVNRGACAARNRGLALAQGDYIQFLDSDDLLHLEKVERQLPMLREVSDSLVFSLHRVVSIEPDAVPTIQWNRRDCADDPVTFMFRGDLPTPAPLHHRSTVEEIGGFREDLACAHDRDFHFRMALGGVRFIPLREVLFTIRRRSGSIGHCHEQQLHEQRGSIAIQIYEQLEKEDLMGEERRLACAAMLVRAARGLYLSNPDLARTFADRAHRIHPDAVRESYSTSTRALVNVFGPRRTEAFVRMYRSWFLPRSRRDPVRAK